MISGFDRVGTHTGRQSTNYKPAKEPLPNIIIEGRSHVNEKQSPIIEMIIERANIIIFSFTYKS